MDRSKSVIIKKDRRWLNAAIVTAMFNGGITKGLERGALAALKEAGVPDEQVTVYEVAGSFEVAQLAMKLGASKRYQAVVALGVIIKGETSHDKHLADAVTSGLLNVGHQTGVAVGLGVITANTVEQAEARAADDDRNRGYGSAAAAVNLADHFHDLSQSG